MVQLLAQRAHLLPGHGVLASLTSDISAPRTPEGHVLGQLLEPTAVRGRPGIVPFTGSGSQLPSAESIGGSVQPRPQEGLRGPLGGAA